MEGSGPEASVTVGKAQPPGPTENVLEEGQLVPGLGVGHGIAVEDEDGFFASPPHPHKGRVPAPSGPVPTSHRASYSRLFFLLGKTCVK